MRQLSLMCALTLLATTALGAKDSPISVFGFQVLDHAKAKNIPVAAAVGEFKAAGVTGFDCDYGDKFVGELVAAGLKPVNFYGDMRFFQPDLGAKQADEFVAAAEQWQVKLIMALPDEFTGRDDEGEFARIVRGFNLLIAKAKAKGIAVTTEDYGWHRPGKRNACGYTKWIKRLVRECPGLKFTIDTGNLMFTEGQSAVYPLAESMADLTIHCHLKDLCLKDGQKHGKSRYQTLGAGEVPNERIVRMLESRGYRGWYTLENLVGDDLVRDARLQVGTLRAWCK